MMNLRVSGPHRLLGMSKRQLRELRKLTNGAHDLRDNGEQGNSFSYDHLTDVEEGTYWAHNRFREQWVMRVHKDRRLLAWSMLLVENFSTKRTHALVHFYTLPEMRQCGLGRMLFQRITEFCEERDVTTLVASAWNTRARTFFTQLGFVSEREARSPRKMIYKLNGDQDGERARTTGRRVGSHVGTHDLAPPGVG